MVTSSGLSPKERDHGYNTNFFLYPPFFSMSVCTEAAAPVTDPQPTPPSWVFEITHWCLVPYWCLLGSLFITGPHKALPTPPPFSSCRLGLEEGFSRVAFCLPFIWECRHQIKTKLKALPTPSLPHTTPLPWCCRWAPIQDPIHLLN